MILKTLHSARGALARYRLHKNAQATIDPSAKVNYRKIAGRPPSVLRIGAGSMVDCLIMSDRPGSEIVVGDHTFIGNSTLITASRIEIGDDVLISWGCTIVDHHSHSILWRERAMDVRNWYEGKKDWSAVKIAPVRVGDKAWIGFNVIILAGVTIGEGAVVASGSIVTKDVAPYTVVAGSPARQVKEIVDGR
jgi:acetyltransferase-like isoleucine patch superfamily enzyme